MLASAAVPWRRVPARVRSGEREVAVKIAMVAACPFPSLRGSQALVRGLAEQLARVGHEVHVATYPIAQHILPIRRIALHRVPRLPGLWTVKPLGWQKALLDVLLVWVTFRLVRRQKLDLLHVHNVEGAVVGVVVSWLTGVPVVYHAHNALADELPRYFRRAWARRVAALVGGLFDRWVCRFVDHVIALSDRLAAYLSARGGIGRTTVVPPLVLPFRTPRRSAAKGGRPLVMYAGNADPYQDLGVLMAAFEEVRRQEPTARLVIATHPPSHRQVAELHERLASRPGVSVRVVGSVAAMLRELAQADVLVCPRSSWSGFPIKVLNYMALGRPILQARGSAHAVEDGVSGLIFEDGDAFSLAILVLRMVRNPGLGDQLGQRCKRVLGEKYDSAATLRGLSRVYDSVLRGRGTDRGERETGSAGMGENGRIRRRSARPRIAPQTPGRSALGRLAVLLAFVVFSLGAPGCAPRQYKEPPAPLPPLAPPPQARDFGGEYRLLPGDVLRVKYLYHPEYDLRVPVGPDGTVSIQDVGVIKAEGKTPRELAKRIEQLSSKHLREPVVNVIIAEMGPHKVFVGGEVRNPGFVVYREGLTPLQAILDRGGFTDTARTDSVLKITNYDPRGPQSTRLDLSGTLREGSPESVALQVADVLWVPQTFIGDANDWVRLYIRNMLPIDGRFAVPAF